MNMIIFTIIRNKGEINHFCIITNFKTFFLKLFHNNFIFPTIFLYACISDFFCHLTQKVENQLIFINFLNTFFLHYFLLFIHISFSSSYTKSGKSIDFHLSTFFFNHFLLFIHLFLSSLSFLHNKGEINYAATALLPFPKRLITNISIFLMRPL